MENTFPEYQIHSHIITHIHKVGMEVAELSQDIKLTAILRGKAWSTFNVMT
jgi:hypothetical protein